MLSELPIIWLILIDSLAWLVIHLSLATAMAKVPLQFFKRNRSKFKTFAFEKEGSIYQKYFFIKLWKDQLPDSSQLLDGQFNLKHLSKTQQIERFIDETCRAEMTHWLSIFPSLLFFIWNPWWLGVLMVVYALTFNLPFIIVQRYNRPRLINIYYSKRTS